MPLHLKSIHVTNLGPLAKFELEFGLVNLIYGPNESGKTHLVEFIIQSLFQTKKIWQLRDVKAQGIIKIISTDGDDWDFTLSKKPKLDDILGGNQGGISNPLSRLLVVKGAELDLSDQDPAGVGYDFIGQILSSSRLCHSIQEKLSDSMKKCQLEGKAITGPNTSDNKKRQIIKLELDNLTQLLDDVNQQYSTGELAELRNHIRQVQSRFDHVNAARRHHAYKLAARKQNLEDETSRAPNHDITKLVEKFREYQSRIRDLDEQRGMAELAVLRSKEYAWLEEATQAYEKLLLMIPTRPRNWILYLSIVAFIVGLVFIIIRQQYPAAISVSIAMVLAGYYIYQLQKSLEKRNASNELERLAHSFQERFGVPLGDVAELRARRDEQKRSYDFAQELGLQINSRFETLRDEEVQIAIQLQHLTGITIEKQVWEDTINGLLITSREKDKEIRDIDLELAGLAVNPADYLGDDPGESYDEKIYHPREAQLTEIKKEYEKKENELQSLKQRVCTATCQDISVSWEEIIQSLRLQYQDKANEYRFKSAELIAGILVNQELEQLQTAEREQIEAGLNDLMVRQPLYQLTGRYQVVDLDGNELVVSDAYNRFRLSDLSTGAREQVLLALRMGFAARILGQESAFMILDDAFQHSDWKRREQMLNHVTHLTQSGWQVIYFSMDDHIRDLFQSRFSEQLGKDFIFKAL